MVYLLIGYMWLFIHRPFEVWPWLGALRIERVYMLITIAYWALFATKTWTSNRVNWGIGLFALAMICSTALSPYTDFGSVVVQNWFKVAVFFAIVMSTVQSESEFRFLVIGFVLVLGFYELHSLREYMCGRHVYRMGTARMVGVDATMSNPNSFGATVNYGIPMLLPVLFLCTKNWQRLAIAGLFGLASICILLTGSRTAFVGLCFQLLVLGLVSRYRWKVIAILFVLLPVVWTLLPEDRQERYLTLIDPTRGPANAQASAEGRMKGFLNGTTLWQESPLFGVGPAAHGKAIGHGFRSHNLYGQVLGNYGTLGAFALTSILFAYSANFAEAAKLRTHLPKERDVTFLYAVCVSTAFGCVLLLLFGWGGHNLLRYTWLWYAAFQALALQFLRQRAASMAYDVRSKTVPLEPNEETFPDAPNWEGCPG